MIPAERSMGERSMGGILRRLGFARLSARPRHPQSERAAAWSRGSESTETGSISVK